MSLLSKWHIEARIRGINAGVQIIRTRLRPEAGQEPVIDLGRILGVDAFNLDKILTAEPDFLAESGSDHQHDASVGSVGFRLACEMNGGRLNEWVGDLVQQKGNDLYRYKV